MARTNKVEVEIVATDEASPKIDKLEAKIDGLEADEARIVVTASTDRLEAQLAQARAKLEGLSGDELTVQARLVGTIEQDLADAKRLFDQLDGQTGTVKLTADTSGLKGAKSQLDELTEAAGSAGVGLGKLGAVLGAAGPAGAAAAAVGAIATGLFAAANAAADLALEASVTAQLTGASVEQASRLQAVWTSTGAGVNDLNDVLVNMNGVLQDTDGLAQSLGINLADGRNGVERMLQVIDRVSKSTLDAQAQAKILSQLFGEEGVRQVARLTAMFPELAEAMERVSDARVVSDEEVEAAREFNAEMAELTASLQQFAQAIGTTVVPALTFLIDDINDTFIAAENLGRGLRSFFDETARRNFEITDEFDEANAAARAFDRSLLDGLTTFAAVRAKVLEVTGSQHAASVVALEWKENQEAAAFALEETAEAGDTLIDVVRDLIDKTNEYVDAKRDEADEIRKTFELMTEQAIAYTDAKTALEELVDAQDDLRESSLADALDAGDSVIDTLTATHQIEEAIRDLAAFIKAEGVPNIFDPNDIDAAPFLSKIDSLAGPIQEQVAAAFAESGPAAAQRVADTFAQQLAAQTGIPSSTIKTLLGLDDLTATIKVALDETDMANAKTQLDILVGLQGKPTPYTATIALALQAGTITPQQALTLIQQRLGEDFDVPIPTELQAPDTARAIADAQRALDAEEPVSIRTRFVSADRAEDIIEAGGTVPSWQGQVGGTTNVTVNAAPGGPTVTFDNFTIWDSRNGQRDSL